MKTFGQVIVAARKAAGLTQKAVAESLRRADGRNVLPSYLNDLEHDRRYSPENEVIEQLAKILKISAAFLYFYARRLAVVDERANGLSPFTASRQRPTLSAALFRSIPAARRSASWPWVRSRRCRPPG